MHLCSLSLHIASEMARSRLASLRAARAQVYAEHTASRTFLHALADQLGAVRSAPACLERVEALLATEADAQRDAPATRDRTRDSASRDAGAGVGAGERAGQLQEGPGDSVTARGIHVVNTLLDVLGCDTPEGARLMTGSPFVACWQMQTCCTGSRLHRCWRGCSLCTGVMLWTSALSIGGMPVRLHATFVWQHRRLHAPRADLIASIQQLQARLDRFDAQLPKYQRAMSKVIEILKIRSIDDVVPAVQRLVHAKTRARGAV
jgi:hypothetical protein